MKNAKHLIILVAVIVAAFFIALYANEQYSRYIDANQTRADVEWKAAMANWKKVHVRIVDAIARDSVATKVIDSARAIASTAIAEANRIRNSRPLAPALTDSTNPTWHRLYVSALAEDDSLRSAHRADSTALGAALWARDSLRAVLLTADTAGTRTVNAGATAIKASQCRVAWLFPCPSRRLAAVGGFVLGTVATIVVENSRHSAAP
jgi:hypothetical protein